MQPFLMQILLGQFNGMVVHEFENGCPGFGAGDPFFTRFFIRGHPFVSFEGIRGHPFSKTWE